MSSLRTLCDLAFTAVRRNRVQSSLAVLGVMIGVGALVTSLALGRGAQQALNEQLLAAGVNMIVVTAGNYQTQRRQRGDVDASNISDHASLPPPKSWAEQVALTLPQELRSGLRSAVYRPEDERLFSLLRRALQDGGLPSGLLDVHFEDDPMELHDHPTAKERLGDTLAGLGAAATLTLADAEAIRAIPGVQTAASGVHENARITRADDQSKQWLTRMHGTEAGLPTIRRGWTFPYGRFLNEREVAGSEQVMVLGKVAAESLYGAGVNPVGQTILLWNQEFKVVGVVDSASWAVQPVTGDDQFDAFYVPVTTVHRLLNLSKLNTITVTTVNAGGTGEIAKVITALLRERHGITEQMPDDFTVRTQAEQVLSKGLSPELALTVGGNLARMEEITMEQISASLQRANRTMLALLGGVAMISLIVGGIGVMNLQLLSVTQRTREVGLRMAMGARKRDIAAQFVSEATMISLAGGVLGLLAGLFASSMLEGVLQWSTTISPLTMVLALVVAAALGIIAGVYPAQRAAGLDPIGALRFE